MLHPLSPVAICCWRKSLYCWKCWRWDAAKRSSKGRDGSSSRLAWSFLVATRLCFILRTFAAVSPRKMSPSVTTVRQANFSKARLMLVASVGPTHAQAAVRHANATMRRRSSGHPRSWQMRSQSSQASNHAEFNSEPFRLLEVSFQAFVVRRLVCQTWPCSPSALILEPT